MNLKIVQIVLASMLIGAISGAYAYKLDVEHKQEGSADFPSGIPNHEPPVKGKVEQLKSFNEKDKELSDRICVKVVYRTSRSNGNYTDTFMEYLQCRTGNLECVIVPGLSQVSCVRVK